MIEIIELEEMAPPPRPPRRPRRRPLYGPRQPLAVLSAVALATTLATSGGAGSWRDARGRPVPRGVPVVVNLLCPASPFAHYC